MKISCKRSFIASYRINSVKFSLNVENFLNQLNSNQRENDFVFLDILRQEHLGVPWRVLQLDTFLPMYVRKIIRIEGDVKKTAENALL